MSPAFACSGAEISLNNCQTGIEYYLYFQSFPDKQTPDWIKLTEHPVVCNEDSAINFGVWADAGVYHILGVNPITNCTSWMENSTTILPNPTAFIVQPQGFADCEPVVIYLEHSEAQVTYYLWRKDDQNNMHLMDSIKGTGGAVHFKTQTGAGTYSVKAKWSHQNTDCWTDMVGAVIIGAPPVSYTLMPATASCPPVSFYLTNSQDSVTYELWSETEGLVDTIQGSGGAIYFKEVNNPGKYKVKARNQLGCEKLMSGIREVLPQPNNFIVTLTNGFICLDEEIEIGLSGSDEGFTYELHRVSASNNPLHTIPGNGYPIVFKPTSQLMEGTYRVKAKNDATGCSRWMDNTIKLYEPPNVYEITANGMISQSGFYCPPVDIGLRFSQPGVLYSLMRNEEFVDSLPGNNGSLSFGSFSEPGNYEIVGINLVTTCDSKMTGFVNISDGPARYNLISENPVFCPGDISSVTIILEDSQYGVEYQLYKNDLTNPVGEVKHGNNSALIWNSVSQYGGGNYFVVARFPHSPGCEANMLNTITVTELSLPTASLMGSAQICETQCTFVPVSLTGSNLDWSITYTVNGVSFTDIIPASGPYQLEICPDGTGTAVVQIVEIKYNEPPACPGTVSGTYFVNIQPLPSADAGPDFTICEASGKFSLTQATAQYYSAINWSVEGPGSFSNPTELNPNFIIPNITEPVNVKLILTAFGSGECMGMPVSSTFTLNIEPLPEIVMEDTVVICESLLSYQLNPEVNYFNDLLWTVAEEIGYFDNPTSQNPKYFFPDVSEPTIVNLILTASGDGSCIGELVSSTFTLQIDPMPIIFAGPDTTICEASDTLKLSQATAQYYSAINWSVEGPGSFRNPTDLNPDYIVPEVDSLTFVKIVMSAFGVESCQGDQVSSTFLLQIDPLPNVSAGNSLEVCVADNIQITEASAEYYTDIIWTAPPGLGSFDDSNRIDPYFTPSIDAAGSVVTLTLTATSIGSCINISVSDQVLVTVDRLPEVEAGEGGSVCYLFTGNNSYTIPQDEATVEYAASYLWTIDTTMLNMGYLEDETTLTPTFYPYAPASGKTITILLTATGQDQCVDHQVSDTRNIKVGSSPYVQFQAINNKQDSTLCCCSPAYFKDMTFFGVQFPKHPDQIIKRRIWDFGDDMGTFVYENETIVSHNYNAPGIYDVTLEIETEIDGMLSCGGIYTTQVTINSLPVADFIHQQINYCDGQIQFTDISTGSNINKYWWKFEDGVQSYYSDLQNPLFEYLSVGIKTVTFTVTDNNGCQDVTTKSIIVEDFFNFEIQHNGQCFNDLFEFWVDTVSITPTGNKIIDYSWSFGDGSPVSKNPVASHQFDYSGSHSVLLIARDESGCEKIKNYDISISEELTPYFTHNECEDIISFTNQTVNNTNSIKTWIWDFGDGKTDTISNSANADVTHQYLVPGIYPVTFTVIDSVGCTAFYKVDSVRSLCIELKSLYVPNAMYPEYSKNPDDEVRFFKPKGLNMQEYKMQIYDLWGNLLWESTKLDNNGSPVEYWDGTYKNNLVPPGNYLWKAYAKFRDGTVWSNQPNEKEGEEGVTTGTVYVIR